MWAPRCEWFPLGLSRNRWPYHPAEQSAKDDTRLTIRARFRPSAVRRGGMRHTPDGIVRQALELADHTAFVAKARPFARGNLECLAKRNVSVQRIEANFVKVSVVAGVFQMKMVVHNPLQSGGEGVVKEESCDLMRLPAAGILPFIRRGP